MSWRAGHTCVQEPGKMIRPTAQHCRGDGICFIESFLAPSPKERQLFVVLFILVLLISLMMGLFKKNLLPFPKVLELTLIKSVFSLLREEHPSC